ncbi:MAG TPA: TIM barrel protein [Pseudoflavonifractor sp.]|nr:TIM barrel protein [Pseudoflavonifractor sp.]
MIETISFPVYDGSMAEYGGHEGLQSACRALGCGGIEALWGGDGAMDALPDGFAPGYHLTFYPDWVDFWRGDEPALLRKFGSREAYVAFYGGPGRESLVEQYRADLRRAARLGARYTVFHVSDVSIEEGYTYRWEHSDEEVMDASIELVNLLLDGSDYPFALLVENQWWPGFTLTDPAKTAYLLNGIHYANKGILLDTGHLMNADPGLLTEADGIAYIHRMLDAHGDLARYIRGMHLHQSLSGPYVRANTGRLPERMGDDYVARFGESYRHILQIDQHRPWTDPAIAGVIRRIGPEFLTHELSCKNRAERERAVVVQRETLRKGGLYQ